MIMCLFMNYTNGTNLAINDSSINKKEKVKEFLENRFEKDGFTYSKSTIFKYENISYKLTHIINKKNLN